MYTSTLFFLAGLTAAAPTKRIWYPAAGTSWQIVLNQKVSIDTALSFDAQVYDLDLFETSAATINDLHNNGKRVICYFSAGSYEPYRPDSSQFKDSDMGSVMEGWEDEKWLKITSSNVRKIMTARIALAASKGCDAIDPDNVDGYSNANGINLQKADAIKYVQWMSKQATSRGMSIGLKNAGEMVKQVLPSVQFSVNEQCHQYEECALYQPFIKANKPVFNIEYPDSDSDSDSVEGTSRISEENDLCNSPATKSAGFSTVLKNMDLDISIQECPASQNYSRTPAPTFSAATANSKVAKKKASM
ncbi:hypothetical protein CAC42_7847 [Sphaceloma murrayae]|uniref:alpha-galactosidase n=1 Tax=Sphaceloma murrayae TaxID=2082308 RepID=A0A2K1QY13_9PEZI|nr:hypothetical protein CAC42_7847 [Sphaceloma murrayae]